MACHCHDHDGVRIRIAGPPRNERRLAELRRRLAAAEDALPGWVRASRLAVQSLAIRLLHLSAVFGCRPSQRRRSATKSLAKSRAGNFNFRKFTKLDSFITEVRRDKASS